MSDESDGTKDKGPALPSAADLPDDGGPAPEMVAGADRGTEGEARATPDDDEVSLVKHDPADPTDVDGIESEDSDSVPGERESALVGASAGSARAAARRSGVRSGTTATKGAATRPRDVSREKRAGVLARLRRFLREVVAELRKVIWPARNQMVTYTIVVIVFVVFMVALVAGLDVLFAKGVLTVFG